MDLPSVVPKQLVTLAMAALFGLACDSLSNCTGKGRVAYLEKSCSLGDAEDCEAIGLLYLQAKGVARSPAKARALFQRACDIGNATDCTNLGVLYWEGEVVTKDRAIAVRFFQNACDEDDPTGCFNLGVAYADGEGVAKDLACAATLYEKACNGGDAKGCNNLGALFQRGEGIAQDLPRAVTRFTFCATPLLRRAEGSFFSPGFAPSPGCWDLRQRGEGRFDTPASSRAASMMA